MARYSSKEFADGKVIIENITEREASSVAAAFGCYCMNNICRPINQRSYTSILNGNFCSCSERNPETGFCQAKFYIIPTHSDVDAGFAHQAIECAIRDSVFRKAKLRYSLSWRINGKYLNWESHVVNIEDFIPHKWVCPHESYEDLDPFPNYKNVTHVVLSEANMVGGTLKEKKEEMSKEEVKAELLKIIELIKKL